MMATEGKSPNSRHEPKPRWKRMKPAITASLILSVKKGTKAKIGPNASINSVARVR